MHCRGYADLLESFLQKFALRDLDGVLSPGTGIVEFYIGRLNA